MPEICEEALYQANKYLEICLGFSFLCYDLDIPIPKFSYNLNLEDQVVTEEITITVDDKWDKINQDFRIRYLFGRYLTKLGGTEGEVLAAELIASLVECCSILED